MNATKKCSVLWGVFNREIQSNMPFIFVFLMPTGGAGHGNPFQYSCLENPMDRGAWWATVHRVAQSQTQLKQQHEHWVLLGMEFSDVMKVPSHLIFFFF